MHTRILPTMTLVLALILVLVVMAPSGTVQGAGQEAEDCYVVSWGETLFSIARRLGVTMQDLAKANGITSLNRIQAGQCLRIPEPDAGIVVHTVRRSESLLAIARMYGVTWQDIARANSLLNINILFTGQRLIIPDVVVQPHNNSEEPPQVREEILITSPDPRQAVSSPVTIRGWGRGFESSLAVNVLGEAGELLGEGYVMIDADLGEYGPYEGTVTFEPPRREVTGRIQVFSISPRDGAIEHLSSVTVTLRP